MDILISTPAFCIVMVFVERLIIRLLVSVTDNDSVKPVDVGDDRSIIQSIRECNDTAIGGDVLY